MLTIERADDGVPTARALLAGGLPVIEITLRTPAAIDAVRAVNAGAAFVVSPGTPAGLAQALIEAPIPALPGCATVSEAMKLAALGFTVLRFFPAEPSAGVRWLKAVAEPLPDIQFCPTGGINPDNAASYLALPNVVAVGGSWVTPPQAIAAGDFAGITARARLAAALRP